MPVVSGVYKIQSISHPERVYIGSAVSFRHRWSKHRKDLEKNEHHSPKLQNHFNKYGMDDLVFQVLLECGRDRLRIKEQCYLNIFQPWFNISRFVCNLVDVNINGRTKEHKDKIALAQTNRLSIGTARGALYASVIADEVALHSKVLTQAEIGDLYNYGSGVTHPFF
jgi:group I intron endonuclease